MMKVLQNIELIIIGSEVYYNYNGTLYTREQFEETYFPKIDMSFTKEGKQELEIFDGDEYDSGNTKYYDKGYNLAVKVAYQPTNSIMQSDYDIDFKLPYNPRNGEIDNDFEYLLTDTTDFNSVARDLNSNASWLIKHWKELGHE